MMEMVGRYRIDAWIGEGAMAEVYRAHDTGLDRTVAIKLLRPAFRRDAEVGRRFVQEARAAGVLCHSHIATIFDVGDADGVPYIAMELIEGSPLDEVLRAGGRMSCERVLALGLQLADAVGYAHRQGIVHRDLKPSNILLSPDGRSTTLVDFGVARIGESHAPGEIGKRIGTPRYMSPEQALGLPADGRADLFSLGAVLYEMVSGRTAFSAASAATLVGQIAHGQPPALERIVADCPRGLRFIIERLLAKKPEQRFADAPALAVALRRELDALKLHGAARHRRRGPPLRVRLPAMLAGTTALMLAGFGWLLLDREAAALDRMTTTSGAAIAAFVASNAAPALADNAGLPPGQQDWTPLQAFVDGAAHDDGIASLLVTDAAGRIRAASDHRLIGSRSAAGAAASEPGGLRVDRPIRYAGVAFGRVDLVLRRRAGDDAMAAARALLTALAVAMVAAVAAIGSMTARSVSRPMQRLHVALADVARGDLAFRISHDRDDEFGRIFDAFNRAVEAIEPRLVEDVEAPHAAPPARQAA